MGIKKSAQACCPLENNWPGAHLAVNASFHDVLPLHCQKDIDH